MHHRLIKTVGVLWTILYATFIIWLYATEPRTIGEVATSASVAAGTYQIDEARFAEAHELFRRDQYRAARDTWAQADPARRDPRTQFYIAYAFYREGWGRLYNDDALFRRGLETIDHAISLARGGTLTIEDPDLRMHSAAELKAELEQGLEQTWSDINPMKVVRERK